MNINITKNSWIIEDYIDKSLLNEIKNIINENLTNLTKDKSGYSTSGDKSEQYWLINMKDGFYIDDSRFYEFEKKYREQILNRVKAADLLRERDGVEIFLKRSNAWTVIGDEGSYHTIHNHAENDTDTLTTVLYLEVPDTNSKDNPENNLYLVSDVGVESKLIYEHPGVIHINPEVGKLIIFPSWILHGTYPQTKGIRQSFNKDYAINYKKDTLLKSYEYK